MSDRVKRNLQELMVSPNIAEELEDEELAKIASDVIIGHNTDLGSRSEWLQLVEDATNLAKLKSEPKSWPWKDAASVKFPLITTAVLQFAARSYPEIIRTGKVVEVQAIGKDETGEIAQRARRVGQFMSYQLLLERDGAWERGTDKLLHQLPVVGTMFRKTYYHATRGYNCSDVLSPLEVIIHNDSSNLEEAKRVTHVISMTSNTLLEHMRAGVYCQYDLYELSGGDPEKIDPADYKNIDHKIYEQHRYLDLDGDGYEEPYIVTVHVGTSKVLRIVARFDFDGIKINEKGEIIYIEPVHYFTDYHFIPSPDGKYYSFGFGTLLFPMNQAINSLINQMLDAGTLSNMQAGIIGKGLRIKTGDLELSPGKFIQADSAYGQDIKSNIYMMDYKPPSPVLFQLLGFLIEYSEKLISVSDTLSGTEKAQNAPATTILTLVEQGLKVFSAIMRRQHWSFKKEFAKVFRLNGLYLDPEHYQNVLNEQVPLIDDGTGNMIIGDFEPKTLNVKPVSDPNVSSDSQRLAKIQFLQALLNDPKMGPHLNPLEILTRALVAGDIPQIELLIIPQPAQTPDPKLIAIQQESASKAYEAEQEARKYEEIEKPLAAADLELKAAQAKKLIADAFASSEGVKQAKDDHLLEGLKMISDHHMADKKTSADIIKARMTNEARKSEKLEKSSSNS